jgi:hypothetical protein
MGVKNLTTIDPFSAPVKHPEYFYPLTLQLDAGERESFNKYFEEKFKDSIGNEALYSPLSDAKQFFPQTVAQTNEFLKPLGLKVRNLTVFVSAGDVYPKNIHVDGTKMPDGQTDVILEARLSYYEMAVAPGIIRWFPKNEDYIKQVIDTGKAYGLHWQLPWIVDLKHNRITWEEAPDYVFATSSNAPSAILRTNLPHHVIQGPGIRLTISAQLVFADTSSPVGVWDHIEKNIHLVANDS